MKALLLATTICIFYVALVTIAFRFSRANVRTARFLTRLFLLTVPLAIAACYLTPGDLGFLPASLVENPTSDIAFTLFIYGSVVFGGVMQVYALADRGFSLRISIDIEMSGGCMTVQQVIKSYSLGKGTLWMYQKRIDGLANLGLIEMSNDQISVTPSGQRLALRLLSLRNFLRVEA
jgi:hypothetical protein